MTIYGYARESTTKQDLGLAAQVRELKKAGCEVIVTDKGQSGETNLIESKAWASIADQIKPGDILKVWSQSRLGRESYEVQYVVGRLTKRGIPVHLLEENRIITDLDDIAQNASLAFKSVADHQERVEIKKRILKANEVRRDFGGKLGRKPALTSKDVQKIKAFREQGWGYTAIGKLVQHKLADGRLIDTNPQTVKKALDPDYVTRDEWDAHNEAVRQKIKRSL